MGWDAGRATWRRAVPGSGGPWGHSVLRDSCSLKLTEVKSVILWLHKVHFKRPQPRGPAASTLLGRYGPFWPWCGPTAQHCFRRTMGAVVWRGKQRVVG